MLLAADISSHNTITDWTAFLNAIDILIVKVTQGTTYVWSGAPSALAKGRGAGKLIGAYHFAGDLWADDKTHPGDPVAEADYFLAHYSHQPGEVIILDFEPTAMPADPDSWCAAFMQRVIDRTGVVPMDYENNWTATKASGWVKTRALNPGLWSAWYWANNGTPQPGEPSFAPWNEVMWQWTSVGTLPGTGPIDLSRFYGDHAAWIAYGTPGGDMPLTDADKAWLDEKLRPIYDTLTPGVEGVKFNGDLWQKVTETHDKVVTQRYPYSDRVGVARADADDLDGQVLSTRAAVEEVKALVGQQAAPVIDEAKLAAALLADPAAVQALGKAIADNLQLAPRSAASGS